MLLELDDKWLQNAYKKLKSSIYFDKTQLPLRNMIVEFEAEVEDMDKVLEGLWEKFQDSEKWLELENEILESIKYRAYPKRLVEIEEDIITNTVPEKHEIDKIQYYIHMDVKGHIFSVLWLLMIGWRLDKEGYEHSYGNRIRKNLINAKTDAPTYSPYLFRPYFEQYESWRDAALQYAQKCLTQKQDVLILSLDFTSYYYSIDMTRSAFDKVFGSLPEDLQNVDLYRRINGFVFKVICQYASLFNEFEGRNILPIGFLPSNVLANWYLSRFDQAISDGWNPVYYGRYVDDIIIVDKIEHNSDLYQRLAKKELTKDEIIQFFTTKCSRWNGFGSDCGSEEYILLIKSDKTEDQIDSDIEYTVNPHYYITQDSKTNITLQNSKVTLFYFHSGETDALITCFREAINKNKSEFRFMPEDEAVFCEDDYSEIYLLNNKEGSPNKLRGVQGASVDKFKLSKFLGKYLRISGLVNDNLERRFERDIDKILNERVAVENYTAWEKIIEIMVINEQYAALKSFSSKLIDAISNIKVKENDEESSAEIIQTSLLAFFHSALTRSFALNWHKDATICFKEIYDLVQDKFPEYSNIIIKFDALRENYVYTRMIDKSVIPVFVFIDALVDKRDIKEHEVNLTSFCEIIKYLLETNKKTKLPDYIYYPYIVTMYDLAIFYSVKQMLEVHNSNNNTLDMLSCFKEQKKAYVQINYRRDHINSEETSIVPPFYCESIFSHSYGVKINNGKKDRLSIAVANTQLSYSNFEAVLKDTPNRRYSRYQETSSVINSAIKENADILVMPESYLPFEWLQTVARTCAKNQMALVSGIEHIKIGNCVFNLTAVILPYMEEDIKSALMTFHLKKHYAPDERREIEGYRLRPISGTIYELYCWNDCWFPVYCCYELASIQDRAIFQSYADMLIAVEWNKDTNYYSNVLESLSRDLHCYCVQVNSSNYGDSRITQPSKIETKDLIRTKGGKNNTVLVDTLDIAKLRDFQYKEFELQKSDKTYKPTPPQFNPDIIGKKIRDKLWDYIIGEEN